ncbi:uncharacterized protein LOC105663708 isoform X2 [Megachile rotundata]|uniref:uncharacterized protein LOC105663708 isoform X2 n=1 Tax=Megachile rotundata TaxID=143995 RepID=UPI000615213D|nr:PREDICTED: RNA polymerase II degradation factor 1 isoform X2 [Megachile rotundata]
MAQWMTFVLFVVAAVVAVAESRAIPAEPIMLDPYGNPIVFLREKRTAVHPYPHRAMMFTGYYRPVRRSSHGGQATGVFAQGNAVSGEAFFGGMQAPHLKNGPEPIEEPEVSSAEAEAAPEPEHPYSQDEQTQEQEYQPEEQVHQHQQEEQYPQEEVQEEQHKQHLPPQNEQPEPEAAPTLSTEASPVTLAEESHPSIEVTTTRPKVQHGKKTKKTQVVVEEDDDDDEEYDDEPVVPFVPFKGNRRRQNYPNLNNFFPMVFSFPGASSRSGAPGSPPGAVTAIANSYSTGKGGVANSVATAYGGSHNGKKKPAPTPEE